jgi:acyl-CoA dehydrogenase
MADESLFALPWELRELQAGVRELVERELIPLERQGVGPQRITDEQLARVQQRVKDMGLWLLDVSEHNGGPGLSLLAKCLVYEEVGKAPVLEHRSLGIFGPRVGAILEGCKGDQRKRFLEPLLRGEIAVCFAQTESEAGSDPRSIRTRAVRDGDHYVLNGTKRFISAGGTATHAQLVCHVVDQGGRPTADGLTILMVDLRSVGVTLTRLEPTMPGDQPAEFLFEDVRVPVADRLGAEGGGFALAQGWLMEGRLKGQAARSVGIGQRALELTIEYANGRETFGEPLARRQAVQFAVADAASALHRARLMVYETAARFDRGEDVRNASMMAKVHAVETASSVVDTAIQVHGGVGLTTELPLEYWYRQLRSMRITEGPHEVLRWRVGRNLLRSGVPTTL